MILKAPTVSVGADPDDVTLVIDGNAISGWTSIRITRGVERCPSDFELTLTELYPDDAHAVSVQPGDECRVFIGDDLVVSGFINKLSPSIKKSAHEISVIGRGACQDLVDCCAEWEQGQMIGGDVAVIAERLASRYGIAVKVTPGTDLGSQIPKMCLNQLESPYEVVERIARSAGVLAYETTDGALLLTGVGSKSAASGFEQGINVESAAAFFSDDQKFNSYRAYIQSVETLSDLGNGGNLIAETTDPSVRRHRVKNIIAEHDYINFETTKRRCYWEAARRLGRSREVRISTDSWRDVAGALYDINTRVMVHLPTLKIEHEEFVITELTYTRAPDQGTRCDLVLMMPEGLMPEPITLLPQFADVVLRTKP